LALPVAAFTLSVAFLALAVALLLPLLTFFLALPASLISFFLTLALRFLARLLLLLLFLPRNPALLLLNSSLLLSELFPYPLPLGLSGLRLSSVFLVRLCAALFLGFGCLLTNFGGANRPYALLDRVHVDELTDDVLRLLVDSAPLEGTVD
jgi:hypothetical protein